MYDPDILKLVVFVMSASVKFMAFPLGFICFTDKLELDDDADFACK